LAAQKTLAAEAAAEAEDLRRRQDEWSEKLAVEIEDMAEKIEAAARTVGQG
jgi:KaiC/GvpD/RAD55 family RecA-like ATPase